MRIIGGKYKGKRILVPSSFRARPTTDFAREGLFNILANTWDFEGLVVLDLFAGTGSIGFEFASRGAAKVDMVEADARTSRFLQRTADGLMADNVRIIHSHAIRYINNCVSRYDIIFADPPYDLDTIPDIPDTVFESEILEEGAWFILEHGRSNSFSANSSFLELRKYGSVHFSFFS